MGAGSWAEHAYAFMARGIEPLAQSSRPLQGVVEFVAADQHVGQRGVGRVVHPAAELQLFFVEADEVVAGGVLDGVVILEISLQHDLAGSLAASGASSDLGEQLEGALGGAKVGQAEGDVGSDHTYERDAVNVVAFGDHLRADEEIEFAFVQAVECALEIFVAADGVAVEAGDAGLGEHAVEKLFEFF